MKVRELKKIIDSMREESLDKEVGILIWGFYATEPRVALKAVYEGFDWSSGYLMLVPEKELTVKEVS